MAIGLNDLDAPTRQRLLSQRAAHHTKNSGLEPNTSGLRDRLKTEGFKDADLDANDTTRLPEPESHDDQAEKVEEKSGPVPPAAAPQRGGSRATVGGFLLAVVVYAPVMAFTTSGPTGLKEWFKAKFLNDTVAKSGQPGSTVTFPDKTGTHTYTIGPDGSLTGGDIPKGMEIPPAGSTNFSGQVMN